MIRLFQGVARRRRRFFQLVCDLVEAFRSCVYGPDPPPRVVPVLCYSLALLTGPHTTHTQRPSSLGLGGHEGGLLTQRVRHVVGSGWPWRALWSEPKGIIYPVSNRARQLESVGGFLDVRLDPWVFRFVDPAPVRVGLPIWPGFLADSLFYAALLWLLIPGPFVLRRFIRMKRGLLPEMCAPDGRVSHLHRVR